MSHYNIDYSGMSDIDKHNKAIMDIKDWMGDERFNKLTEAFRNEYKGKDQPSLEKAELMMSFCGVQGYPCKAWYNVIWPL